MFTDTWQIILKIRCENKVNSFFLRDYLGKDIYLENLSHIKRWTSGKAEVFPRKIVLLYITYHTLDLRENCAFMRLR